MLLMRCVSCGGPWDDVETEQSSPVLFSHCRTPCSQEISQKGGKLEDDRTSSSSIKDLLNSVLLGDVSSSFLCCVGCSSLRVATTLFSVDGSEARKLLVSPLADVTTV